MVLASGLTVSVVVVDSCCPSWAHLTPHPGETAGGRGGGVRRRQQVAGWCQGVWGLGAGAAQEGGQLPSKRSSPDPTPW